LLREWINLLPLDVGSIDPFPNRQLRDPLPSSRNIDGPVLEKYWRFVYGENTLGLERKLKVESPSLLPVDLTTSFKSIISWPRWVDSSPQIFSTILRSPNAIRTWSDEIDTNVFLRSLIDTPIPTFSTASELLDHLINLPSLLSTTSTPKSLQPLWYTSIAPLEWIPSSSPSKLASPLGMAVIKTLRIIYGFSESDQEDHLDPGCLGSDDVHVMLDGIWELGSSLFQAESKEEVALRRFAGRSGSELALPALILVLHSRPAKFMPILLGLSLALNVKLWDRPGRRLGEIRERSRVWLLRAIEIGLEAEKGEGKVVGWGGEGTWAESVGLGVALGLRGLREVCPSVSA